MRWGALCTASAWWQGVGQQDVVGLPQVIETIFRLVQSSKATTVLWKNAIAVLQKLSIRPSGLKLLLKHNVAEWICTMLLDADELCDYSLEYLTALTMKLALSKAGRAHFARLTTGGGTVSVLNALIESENPQINTYVNGALYALLQHAVLKEQAHALGFEELLSCLVSVSEPSIARQFRYVAF